MTAILREESRVPVLSEAGLHREPRSRPATNAETERRLTRYGPWAVVTGASSGIGRALAVELAALGLNLVLVGRREETLRALGEELGESHSIETRRVVADFAEAASADRVLAATVDLDVGLFVAAAGFGTAGDFVRTDLRNELALLQVNCGAVLALTHGFARRLVARGRGGIILFGSLVGFQGTPHAANYAATKAYVQALGEALHLELASKNIDVLVSAPGPVHSGFAARAGMRMTAAEKPATVARATLRALGRTGTVTPGVLSKLLTWSLMTAPRSLRVRIMGKIMGGMTRHLS